LNHYQKRIGANLVSFSGKGELVGIVAVCIFALVDLTSRKVRKVMAIRSTIIKNKNYEQKKDFLDQKHLKYYFPW